MELNCQGGDAITTPDWAIEVQGGDGVIIVRRDGEAARALFAAPAEKMRPGRMAFRVA